MVATSARASELTLSPRAVRRDLHLSREAMGRVLRVSAKTVERWEGRNAVADPRARHDFAKLRQIAELAQAVYGAGEGVEVFLTAPLSVFDGRTALELMSLGDYDRVIAVLAADFEGLGY